MLTSKQIFDGLPESVQKNLEQQKEKMLSLSPEDLTRFLVISMEFHDSFIPKELMDKVINTGKRSIGNLPNPLKHSDGTKISDANIWSQTHRKRILSLFEEYVYGKVPDMPYNTTFNVEEEKEALNGRAVRKQITITIITENGEQDLDLLIYLPANQQEAVPIFLGLNFYGNQSIHTDPEIKLPSSWLRNSEKFYITENKATEKSRGVAESSWPVEEIIENGYGLATIYCGDLDPDFDDGYENGIHPLFYKEGQTKPKDNEWGSIGAWAFGLSRAMDYFETDIEIDHRKVAVLGHSRLGKTALWAGAIDERFNLVISNNSGCTGAAISREKQGETVAIINTFFPHWFAENYKQYNENEDKLPIDQHMLISLIAPRTVYVASAIEDWWADPEAEFLGLKFASPVYQLFGVEAPLPENIPQVNQPVQGIMSYHVRSGEHAITAYDWEQYLKVANKYLK